MLTDCQTAQTLRQATSLRYAATLALPTAHVALLAHASASMHLATALASLLTGEKALLPRPAIGALPGSFSSFAACEPSICLSHTLRTEFCTFPKIFTKRPSQRSAKLAASKHLDRWQDLQTSCALSMPPEADQIIGKGSDRPIGVLFVCLGNICRSPTAEALFRSAVTANGLDDRFVIDSAGTDNYHEGDLADARMRGAAIQRGVAITSTSRPIRREDFEDFDIILAMDRSNVENIRKAFRRWNGQSQLPPGSEEKVKLMCGFCTRHSIDEVPDPYYGGPAGFEKVLDLLEDACAGLLNSLEPQI